MVKLNPLNVLTQCHFHIHKTKIFQTEMLSDSAWKTDLKYSASGCELLWMDVIPPFYVQLCWFTPAKCLVICFSSKDRIFLLEVNVTVIPGNTSNLCSGSNADQKSCCQSLSMHNRFGSCKSSWGLNFLFFWPSNKGLHAQSSFSGSFRKAGALFRNDTVRVTSSPALRRTWTWKRNADRTPWNLSMTKIHHQI